MSRLVFLSLAATALAAPLTGCSQVECGDGSYQNGNSCLPVKAPICGYGTHNVDGACVPDPSAPMLTCGAGTIEVGTDCLPRVNRIGNARRWNSLDLTAPSTLGAAEQTIENAYLDGSAVVLSKVSKAPGGGFTINGGVATQPDPDKIDYFGDPDKSSDLVLPPGADETQAGVLSLVIGSGAVVLKNAKLTMVTVTTGADRVPVVESFHFVGGLTQADTDSVMVGGQTLSQLIGNAPADYDTDGDGTMDGWKLEGQVGATAPGWLL